MLVKDYRLPEEHAWRIKASDSSNVFDDLVSSSCEPREPDIWIWKKALSNEVLQAALQTPNWAEDFLAHFPTPSEATWGVRQSGGFEEGVLHLSMTELLDICRKASHLPATGNAAFDLKIRDYQEGKEVSRGGLSWWRTVRSDLGSNNSPFVRAFVEEMTRMLEVCGEKQLNLHVEQISIIISKDPSSPLASLTPTLHSDTYYGRRETALVSLSEPNLGGLRGTLFVPTVRMDALEKHRPIDLNKLFEILKSETIIEGQSGDLFLYGGMIGADGVPSTTNGVPHISCDQPGLSSRLIVLMKNFN
jgi:hypothetical protein